MSNQATKPGRPPAAQRRDAILSVRLTDAELARVQARAAAAREDMADYVRRRLVSVNNNPVPPASVSD